MLSNGEVPAAPGKLASRRLFYALWPDEIVRGQFLSWFETAIPSGVGRPVVAGNLHLTLVFLGEVSESRHECLVAAASRLQVPAFELVFDHIGFWPRPQVLWAGCVDCPHPLQLLVHGLQQAARDCGLNVDSRPWYPHLTMMRKVSRRPVTGDCPPLRWVVEYFVLVQSIAGPKGVSYRVLQRWPLAGSGLGGNTQLWNNDQS